MKKKKLNKWLWLALLSLLIAVLWVTKAFFHPGFYTSHDGRHQLVRLYQFHRLLNNGQLPVRWSEQLNNGYGYPLFNFSYQLPWYFGEIFLGLGWSLTDTVKALFVLATGLSVVFMFLWQRQLWGLVGGWLAALLWLWAPYRFSLNLVRAALGEAFCLAFAPLLFLAIERLYKQKSKFIYVAALALGAMILSQVLVAGFYLVLALLYSLFLSLDLKPKLRRKFYRQLLFGFILALGLTSFYFFPALKEKSLVRSFNTDLYSHHFLELKQLFYSPWGYGFSMSGTVDDGMSFQLGIAQWLIFGLSGLALFLNRRTKGLNQPKFVWPFFMSVPVLIFLMLHSSNFIWRHLTKLVEIYLLWRLTSVAVFCLSVLAGFIYQVVKGRFKNRWLVLGLVVSLLAIAFYTNRNHLKVNQYTYFSDEEYQLDTGTANSFDEYQPRWVNSDHLKQKRELVEIKSDNDRDRLLQPAEFKGRSLKAELEINSPSAEVYINQVYYPGWQVLVDGQPASFDYQHNQGVMKLNLNSGQHQLEAVFKETPFRKTANLLAVLSLMILVYGLIKVGNETS